MIQSGKVVPKEVSLARIAQKGPARASGAYRSEEASSAELLWTCLCKLLRLMVQISNDRVVSGAVKKVVERLQKLHLEHQLVGTFCRNFTPDEIEDIALGKRQRPQKIFDRYLLGGTIGTKSRLPLFDVAFGFGDHPFRKVKIEFVNICAQFVGGDATETLCSKIGM
jgi:hypothetical protein